MKSRNASEALHLFQRGADSAWENIEYAASYHANLLLNIAHLHDGSIDSQDIDTLKELGPRIKRMDGRMIKMHRNQDLAAMIIRFTAYLSEPWGHIF